MRADILSIFLLNTLAISHASPGAPAHGGGAAAGGGGGGASHTGGGGIQRPVSHRVKYNAQFGEGTTS